MRYSVLIKDASLEIHVMCYVFQQAMFNDTRGYIPITYILMIVPMYPTWVPVNPYTLQESNVAIGIQWENHRTK